MYSVQPRLSINVSFLPSGPRLVLEVGGSEKPDTAQVPAGCPTLQRGTWGIPGLKSA